MTTSLEDADFLRNQLQLSEEWNMRLQAQIQELMRLPHSEVEAMRERMQNPDIAIPLLQCYDAAIAEKQEENEKLLQEMGKLRMKLESTTDELEERSEAFRVVEAKLKETQMRAQEERNCLEDVKRELEREAAQTRQELARALDAEAALKREVEKLKQERDATQNDVTYFQQNSATLEAAAKTAQSRLKVIANEKEETQQQGEVQRIQLQLLKKENEDKLQELERLRHRMVQALRQVSENHTAHLRVVEEKHREMVEALRVQLNTQELETQKLRAQLARVDVMGNGGRYAMPLRTTTEILEAQTRQAQEMELKRLLGEVSVLQLQRDDAILRYEQLSSSLRREESERIADAQRETQGLRQKVREHEHRCEQVSEELSRVKEELRVQRERSKGHAGDLQRARQERDQSLRKMEELRRAVAAAEETCEQVRCQAKDDVARERLRVREVEQRVEEVLRDMHGSRDRAIATTAAVERERDELRKQLGISQGRISELETQLSARDREAEILTAKTQHLQDAVRLNQKQVLTCEERLQELLELDKKKSLQLREMTLVVERLKREGARAARERDRLIEEVNTRLC